MNKLLLGLMILTSGMLFSMEQKPEAEKHSLGKSVYGPYLGMNIYDNGLDGDPIGFKRYEKSSCTTSETPVLALENKETKAPSRITLSNVFFTVAFFASCYIGYKKYLEKHLSVGK